MGADLTKEYPSTWSQDDVQKWKKKALDALKAYYLGFRGSQWNEFDRSTDTLLLRAQICFALYGSPKNDAKIIENAYEEIQRKKAGEIVEVILKVFDDSHVKNLRVGFIFVACKQEETEFVIPVFSVYVGEDNKGFARRKYVDTQGRVYKDWDDWKNNNRLPMLKYAYPTRGFFTCSGNDRGEFSEERDPDVDYGTSPACDASSRILRQTDNVTGVVAIGAGIVGIIGLFTPLAPVVLGAAAITGGSTAVYGSARGINRLVDKGQHAESLVDLESFTLWFGLAATPLHFATSFVNGTLALGAQQGRIFSSSMRTFATVLNFTTLGVDGTMMLFGLGNLIQKGNNGDLSPLDVLQFSMSVFFFTNTLIQPKVASSIIKQAQEQHIGRYMNSMTDEQAKIAMKNFLDQNKGQGTITDASKVIRTLNRMENSNSFFKNVGPDTKVEIGGRKGRTVLLTGTDGNRNRINPNKIMVSNNSGPPVPNGFSSVLERLEGCYGKDPDDVELNGEKIFKNMSATEQWRAKKTTFQKNIVETAHSISESMGFKTADELMSIMEILRTKVKGLSGTDREAALVRIRGAGRDSFIRDVRNDMAEATRYANKAGLKFDNPLTAVYHYRKHGAEFPQVMKKYGNGIAVYLGPVADKVFNESNLRETCSLPNSNLTRRTYVTSDDQFGVTTSTPDGTKISTIFKPEIKTGKPGRNQEYINSLAKYLKEDLNIVEPVSDTANRLTRFLGLSAPVILITIDGKSTPIDGCTGLDPAVHREIAHMLAAFQLSL